MHPLSRATTYLQTFVINPQTGEHKFRSNATGFFIRAENAILLVTNWHVVTGLDPANPALSTIPPPHYLKANVIAKNNNYLHELHLPLYGHSMTPLWHEHSSGSEVDLVLYPLPLSLEEHFHFIDIQSVEDELPIQATVGKDVFILGYPFKRDEMQAVFGENTPHYMPVWKRGSIATEPSFLLANRVLLIDSLSRAGMSGAPVVVAEEHKVWETTNQKDSESFEQLKRGEGSALDAIMKLDMKAMSEVTRKRFRFLGVYSGTIGSTRLAEIALGKCWHIDVLRDLLVENQDGKMPFHSPPPNEYYDAYLTEIAGGELIIKSTDGTVVKRTQMHG